MIHLAFKLFQFLRGPLLDGLYWETWFDGSNTTPSNLGYIFYENKILGKVRILQMRVSIRKLKLNLD